MKKLAVIFFVVFSCCGFAKIPKPSAGIIKRYENFSSNFVDARNVDVWLPQYYDVHKEYAVLYMHDGQMLYDSTTTWNHQEWGIDETLSALMASKKIRDCIVVGIWNNGKKRHVEYFPQKAYVALSKIEKEIVIKATRNNNQSVFDDSIQSDNYLKFIVKELKPFIDSHFSTLKDQSNTFIAGSSMGGLISMYAICEYPKVFGGAACLSTHWVGIFRTENNPIPNAFMDYLKKHLPSPINHKVYFDYGDKTLDALYKPYQEQVDVIMKAKGFSTKSWMTKFFPGDDHSEKSWKDRFYIPATFLLKK